MTILRFPTVSERIVREARKAAQHIPAPPPVRPQPTPPRAA